MNKLANERKPIKRNEKKEHTNIFGKKGDYIKVRKEEKENEQKK